MNRLFFTVLLIVSFSATMFAQDEITRSALKALGAPNNPKVEVAWNRYYDWKGVVEIIQKLNKAYPDLCELTEIGKSYEGRELYALTITNPNKGNKFDKPAFYIDASVHANEVQAVEVALYTAWYLLENYDKVEFIKNLVDTKTFYIVPFQSPDSRDQFMHSANTANSPRSGQVPRDDDGDGLFDEDGFDDLNGDGHITQMRIKSSSGRWKEHPDFPEVMIRCEPDEPGEYEVSWSEGIDNDGDGKINEDGDGYYDPNRNWGWLWRPHYIQYGSDRFPFSLPESYAIGNFIKSHPNILASQSYHNAGGMILHGPGAKEDKTYRDDDRLFNMVGEKGEKIIPGYRNMTTYKDLYTVYGGETDWHYSGLGIMAYVNELWSTFNMFRTEVKREEGNTERYKFNKYLLFGEAFVSWEEVDHPQYGKVEVGGYKKQFSRMPPSFLLEEECHRNMAFTLLQASYLPELQINLINKKKLDGNLYEVTVEIYNNGVIPTRLMVDVENKISRPDWISISDGKVISGGIKNSKYEANYTEQKVNPGKLSVERIEGKSSVVATWLIEGNGSFTVNVDSQKGGKATKDI